MKKKNFLKAHKSMDWIFMYIEKYDENDKTVQYQYIIDDDNIEHAGKIEIDKNTVYEINGIFNGNMNNIKKYFFEGKIKVIKCPLRFFPKDNIKDYNAIYAAQAVIEDKYQNTQYCEYISKIVPSHFEMYIKHMTDIMKAYDLENTDNDVINYRMEFYRDYWSYVRIYKKYEDNRILRYQYFVDTFDNDNYGIIEFPKKIGYIKCYGFFLKMQRIVNLRINKKMNNPLKMTYERIGIMLADYILSHQKDDEIYISNIILINERTYDYYKKVTKAIGKFDLKRNLEIK